MPSIGPSIDELVTRSRLEDRRQDRARKAELATRRAFSTHSKKPSSEPKDQVLWTPPGSIADNAGDELPFPSTDHIEKPLFKGELSDRRRSKDSSIRESYKALESEPEGPNTTPSLGGSQPLDSQSLDVISKPETLLQLSTPEISEDELVKTFRGIYAGVAAVEKRCKRVNELTNNIDLTVDAAKGTEQYLDLLEVGQQFSYPITGNDTEKTELFEIPGVLGRKHTNALGDYCAKRNFMKKSHAERLGLIIDNTKRIAITIGSGKQITTAGTTYANFRFQGETQSYHLLFHIIPSCIHDVILGKAFLKATDTFSSVAKFARRVKRRVLEGIKQHDFVYLGGSAPRFSGLINGLPQDALADSGAKVPIMDEEFARSAGIPVTRGKEHRTTLRYADCSTVETSGMAYGVMWEFGPGECETYLVDFHILKNAPAGVILSDSFLFWNQAFTFYGCYLVDDEEEGEDGYCFAIDLDVKYDGQGLIDMSSIANLEALEVVRRSERKDEIETLPTDERDDAWDLESERRQQWEQTMDALRASGRSNAATTGQANSVGGAPSTSPTATSHHPAPLSQPTAGKSVLARLKFRLKRRSGT